MRLSHSGKAFHVAFGTQAQEAFLEGHVLAFEHFGGVPGRVRYDNLKPAVIRVLEGPGPDRVRTVHRAAIALRVRLVLLPPRHRRRAREGRRRGRDRPVPPPPPRPVPKVASLAALNELIAAGDLLDDGRVITGRPITIGAAFAVEAPTLMPLPARGVRPGPAAGSPGGQPGQGVGAAMLLLRPGPLRRPTTAGPARRPHGRDLRRSEAGRSPRTGGRTLRRGPHPGSLPRGAQDQARRAARCDRARASQGPRRVHRLASGLLGRRPTGPRRRRRHPGADRGPARAPHHDRRRADRGDGPRCRLRLPRSRAGADRRPPRHHPGRARRPDRRAGPLRPTRTHP